MTALITFSEYRKSVANLIGNIYEMDVVAEVVGRNNTTIVDCYLHRPRVTAEDCRALLISDFFVARFGAKEPA